MTFDAIQASDPDAAARWARHEPDFAFPGGESVEVFLARIRRAASGRHRPEPAHGRRN
jgi:broad specificity phosphatase PhoE